MVDFVYLVAPWLLHFEEYGGGLASKEAFAYPTRSVQVLPRNREVSWRYITLNNYYRTLLIIEFPTMIVIPNKAETPPVVACVHGGR